MSGVCIRLLLLLRLVRLTSAVVCHTCSAAQRLKNHDKDMSHAHRLEERLRPEMSVKPSALWQKRQVQMVYVCVYLCVHALTYQFPRLLWLIHYITKCSHLCRCAAEL